MILFWYITSAVLFFSILFFGAYLAFFRRRRHFSEYDLADIRERFADLERRVYWDPRHAILEGDKLLDLLLITMGYRGSLGDKLKKCGKVFPNVQDLWNAHRLRNQIAHEIDAAIHPQQAKKALQAYKSAFRIFRIRL